MNGPGSALTSTGLIASVLAALFAVAAFTAQRRRKRVQNTLNGLRPDPEPVRPAPRAATPDAGEEPLFRIYSIEETSPDAGAQERNGRLWE